MTITSPKNPFLQEVRRAAHAGRSMDDGCLVLEGPNLLEEAARSRWTIAQIIGTPAARERWPHLVNDLLAPFVEVAESALESIASTQTTQGVITLARPVASPVDALLRGTALVAVLDGVQDPGNAGTLVRSAEAFGASGLIACKGSVRLANGKFLRATAGSIFRLPYVDQLDQSEVLSLLTASGIRIYALSAQAARRVDQVDLSQPCALVIGNEGNGVSEEFRLAAKVIGIPVSRVESLNAAVAGSIALFEAARQRGSR